MTAIDIDADEAARAAYYAEGEARALALPNRGPIRFTDDGQVHPDILDAYRTYGFYVFTGVICPEELAELRAEAAEVLERAPYPVKSSPVDRHGRPALGADWDRSPWLMAPPLSDPVGGTKLNHGRHPVKMHEPTAAADAPAEVPYLIQAGLEMMETFLRVYGHPGLLRVAEAVHGPDFTPFTDVVFVKLPGLGPSVAWHQDGQLLWDDPSWDGDAHGFNFQLQLYGSNPANGVWVVPGSHLEGKIDIKARVEANGGSERLPDAVPIVAGPGDVSMTNRQSLHGSYANSSDSTRITVNFGFHRYSSVVGRTGVLNGSGNAYTPEYIERRAKCIPVAIAARAQRFPQEERYVYAPFADDPTVNRYDAETRRSVIDGCHQFDLGI